MRSLRYHVQEVRQFGLKILISKCQSLLVRLYQPIAATGLFLLLRALRRMIWIRVGTIDTLRLGHHLTGPWHYLLAVEEERPLVKTLDIHFPSLINPNPLILAMWRRELRILPGWIVGGGVPNKWLTERFGLSKGHIVPKMDFGQGMCLARDGSPKLDLSREELAICAGQMEIMGVPAGSSWVALLVRDPAWLDHVMPSKQWRKNDYRDSHIDSYTLACQALLNLGYHVIRLGARVKEALKIHHPRFIDYAMTEWRSEKLDLYLVSRCKFLITTGTGLDAFAGMHRVPRLFVNFNPSCLHNPMPYLGAQVIFKHYVSKDGNLLSLSNILQLGIQDPYESPTILNMGITFKDNSPEEIAEACLEMERWVEVGTPVCAMTDLQNRVMDISKAYTNYQINVPLAPKVAGSFLVRNPHWVT